MIDYYKIHKPVFDMVWGEDSLIISKMLFFIYFNPPQSFAKASASKACPSYQEE
jgi:hypothetical protein